MKKVKLVMVTALALVLFAGCKQKPQEEFTAELAKQSEMNAGSYSDSRFYGFRSKNDQRD